jgi:hypothetical protein
MGDKCSHSGSPEARGDFFDARSAVRKDEAAFATMKARDDGDRIAE